MANLKGSTHQRQIKDLQIRIEARGTKKHTSKYKSHSNALATKRDMYIKDFSKYVQENQIEGKLNQLLTENNINDFLEQRLENLSLTTIENYISGWNSLLNALTEANITHHIRNDYLSDKWLYIKQNQTNSNIHQNTRGIENPSIINELYETKYETGLIAEIQFSLGFRISEAMEIVSNYENYLKDKGNGIYQLEGVRGKGGQIYQNKIISNELVTKLQYSQNIPSLSSYYRHLEPYGISSHDLRYQYAKNLYQSKLDEGKGYHQTLKEVSKELNHHREEISLLYIRS